MGRKKRGKKYIMSDHIFAITIVIVMVLAIVSLPFLFFYLVMYFIALTPDVEIKKSGTIDVLKIIFKFFITAIIITGIVDVMFTQIIKIKTSKHMLSLLFEAILMFLVFYLFVMIYSLHNNEIITRHNGNLYISLFLLCIYIITNIAHLIMKKLHGNIIQMKHNTKNRR
ncbi:hypothetical protein [Heyndrickxia ginsengihumi]|uniref:hypothetical protein n=1 Tax=Heyndrickxia ginsengihumi TaxID=363870 RepID=UPI003D2207CC